MDAYTLVEPPVRRKFEELLLTWKEPPSTGLTTTPVFPVEVTRKIETALLKAKTLALQLEQRRQREMVAAGLVQHRNTPPMSFLNNQPEWNGNTVRAIDYSYSVAHSLQNMVNVYPTTSPSNQDILLGEIRNHVDDRYTYAPPESRRRGSKDTSDRAKSITKYSTDFSITV